MFAFLNNFLTDNEYTVIQKRYFQGQTLQAIGDELALTRERIRQIQNNGLSKLKRTIEKTEAYKLIQKIEVHLSKNNNISSYTKLQESFSNMQQGELELLIDTSNNINTLKKTQNFKHSCYIIQKIDKGQINKTHKLINKKLQSQDGPIKINKLITLIQKENSEYVSQKSINGILEISNQSKILDGKVGHISCRQVNPKSIKDKAIIVLEREHQPLHFKEINKQIHTQAFDRKTVTLEAVHNELIRYEEFVLVGRGLYALSKWGYSKGTVKDIIYKILQENGVLSKKEIVKQVLDQRQVKVGTISLNLQKYPEFKRVGRATYSL